MADNIAKLSVMVTANAQQFDATLEASKAKLEQFAALQEQAKKLGNGITAYDLQAALARQAESVKQQKIKDWLDAPRLAKEAAEARQQVLGNALKGMAQGALDKTGLGSLGQFVTPWIDKFTALAGPIAGVATVILTAATAATALAEAGRRSVKELDSISKKYGLVGTSAAGLRLAVTAAGSTLEEAAGPLGRIQRALGQAGAGSAEAQRNFRLLGLDGLALSRLPLDQSLARIAQRFREIRDPNERAAAAARIFGRNWQESLKIIDKMGDIERFKSLATFFGADLTPREMSRFKENKEAGRELNVRAAATGQGFTQQIFTTAAPILTFLQNAGSRALEVIQPFLQQIINFVKQAYVPLEGIIGLIDGIAGAFKPVWEAAMSAYSEIKAALAELFGDQGIYETFKAIGEFVGGILKPMLQGLAATIRTVTMLIRAALSALQEAQDWLQNTGSTLTGGLISPAQRVRTGSNVNPEAAAGLTELRLEIEQSTERLRAQAGALGGASNAMQIYDLRMRGATSAMLEQLQTAHAEMQVAQLTQQLSDQSRQLLMTADAWRRYQLEREGATASDLAGVERLQFRNAVIQTILRNRAAAMQGPGAGLQAGTREALSAIQAYQRAGQQRNIEEEIRDAIIETRDTERENGDTLRRMEQALDRAPETARENTGFFGRALDAVFGPNRS